MSKTTKIVLVVAVVVVLGAVGYWYFGVYKKKAEVKKTPEEIAAEPAK